MKEKSPFIEPWIDRKGWKSSDFSAVETPCYVVNLRKLEENLKILDSVQRATGSKILMAVKGFSMFSVFPLLRKYLPGVEASSPHEARLCREEFGKEVHVFSPSYTAENIQEYLRYADHLVFNSFSQWKLCRDIIKKFHQKSKRKVSCGIRVNVEHSEVEIPLYDPSRPRSHFGVTLANFEPENLDGIEGLHFHNLCELGADALERTLAAFEAKFGAFLPQMKWVNFGGGHHITRADYDVSLLCRILTDFKKKYPHLEVYLEPGEAIALNAGVLVGSVVDIAHNGMDIAVLDISPTCHMPDVLEIPYTPALLGATIGEQAGQHPYQLVGSTCLTGDVIGTYSFPRRLRMGQKLVFLNMAIYTMVKNNTFNGVNLPSIAILDDDGTIRVIRRFGYQDFKGRLS